MKDVKRIYGLTGALRWLWLLCLPFLPSCTEYEEPETGAMVARYPVGVRIVAHRPDDLNGADKWRAPSDGNTETGQSHEFMNTLCVFIVDAGGMVEEKLLPDLSQDVLARTGDLEEYFSGELILTGGLKTVYAFANWQHTRTVAGTGLEFSRLSGIGKGEKFPAGQVNSIVLDNPSGVVDLANGRYIPMSARIVTEVTEGTEAIDVGLDRLVAKVRLKVQAPQDEAGPDAVLEQLSMGGFADRVGVFADTPVQGASDTVEFVCRPGVSIPSGGYAPGDFYVNETLGKNFTVTMSTDGYSGVVYTGQTRRNEIPRNSIYPLNLVFSGYPLELKATSTVAPIGHVPVEVKTEMDAATYSVDIAEGAQFTLNARVLGKDGGAVSGVSWECVAAEPGSPVCITVSRPLDGVVKGHLAAVKGQKVVLQLTAKWQDGAQAFERKYNVVVLTVDITEVEFDVAARKRPGMQAVWIEETLNLFSK